MATIDGVRSATDGAQSDDDKETDDRPVEPADYALINTVYMVLLTSMVVATRKRAAADPVSGTELVPIAAATFALSKLIGKEKMASWVREPFVEVEDGRPQPRGERLQRAIGELLTCTRCLGPWSALGVVGLRLASPPAGRTVTSVLAASAANDFGQAGFRWLCAKSTRAAG